MVTRRAAPDPAEQPEDQLGARLAGRCEEPGHPVRGDLPHRDDHRQKLRPGGKSLHVREDGRPVLSLERGW